jgi:hypothetical protein
VESPFTAKVQRLIEWNVNVLADFLKQIDMNHRGNKPAESPVLSTTLILDLKAATNPFLMR